MYLMTIKVYLPYIQKEKVYIYSHQATFFFLELYLTLSRAQCHISISLCIL